MMRRDGCWMTPRPCAAAAPLRLFCLPFAGGQASAFYRWAEPLSDLAELSALQLPGRGALYAEPALRDAARVRERVLRDLLPLLDRPYVMLGHSLGGRIAVDLCRQLARLGARLPSRLIVSGSLPPHCRRAAPLVHELGLPEFIAELRVLGGTPDAVLGNPSLLEAFMPVLRADFELFESYTWDDGSTLPLDAELWGGLADPRVSVDALMQWHPYFTGRVRERLFAGGHMFIADTQCAAHCLKALRQSLLCCLPRAGTPRRHETLDSGVHA